MAKYKIKHITHYFYKSPVYESINQIMLYPIQDLHQTLHLKHYHLYHHQYMIHLLLLLRLFPQYFLLPQQIHQ